MTSFSSCSVNSALFRTTVVTVGAAPFDDEKREGRRARESRRLCCGASAASSVEGGTTMLLDRLGAARGPPGTTGALPSSTGRGALVGKRLVKNFGGGGWLVRSLSFFGAFLPSDAKKAPVLLIPIGRVRVEVGEASTEKRVLLREL
jgi:hypothetical protein